MTPLIARRGRTGSLVIEPVAHLTRQQRAQCAPGVDKWSLLVQQDKSGLAFIPQEERRPRRAESASERSLERSGKPWGPERSDGPSQAKPDGQTATRDSQGVRGIGVYPPGKSSIRVVPLHDALPLLLNELE